MPLLQNTNRKQKIDMLASKFQVQNQNNLESGFAGIRRGAIQNLRGNVRTIFLNFLIECNHSDNPDFLFNCEPFPLKRGQWITSYVKLQELTNLSRQQIRTALTKLKKLTNLITNNITNQATLLTLENIDFYLVSKNELTNKITKKKTNHQPTANQPSAINNKEENKDNNEAKNEKIKYDDFHLSIANQLASHIKTKKQISVTPTKIRRLYT